MNNLPNYDWSDRSWQLSEAYLPDLRERHPMGSVVAINLLTAEYVVGEHSVDAILRYAEKFGDDDDMYIEPIHWPDTRSEAEQHAAIKAWHLKAGTEPPSP